MGQVFIADRYNDAIRAVDVSGVIRTVAGTGQSGFSGDGGPATAAQLAQPKAVAIDGEGRLFIADSINNRIRIVDTLGTITTSAGDGVAGFAGDGGSALSARLWVPGGVAPTASGGVVIADTENYRVRRVDASGTISTMAGNGESDFAGDGGAATNAQLDGPWRVAVDDAGAMFIADTSNNRVRRVDPTGTITTIAGDGTCGHITDAGDGGPATAAQVCNPAGVAVDSAGTVYVSTLDVVRKIGAGGVISTYAGSNCGCFVVGDGGPATQADLNLPRGLTTDPLGNLYIAEQWGSRVRKVTPAGIISTIAGTGNDGYTGDGGPGNVARLNGPNGVDIDTAGNVYIADSDNNVIRRVDPAGVISTVAGTGLGGYGGDGGAATKATLQTPTDVAVAPDGTVLVADYNNGRIRRFRPGGHIETVAGTGNYVHGGYFGDGGPATDAEINNPTGIAVSTAGQVLIADTGNHRIRGFSIAINMASTQLLGAGNPASNISLACHADPVNCATGNFWLSSAGLALAGRSTNSSWSRTYNSHAASGDGPYGRGWASTLGMRADRVVDGGVVVRQENGSELPFAAAGGGFSAPSWAYATLETTGSGLTFTRRGDTAFVFDADGHLTEIRNRTGETDRITRDAAGRATTVTTDGGKSATLTTNADGRITNIAGPGGRTTVLEYDDTGHLIAVTDRTGARTSYTYDS